MAQTKEQHREWMRTRRKGAPEGAQKEGAQPDSGGAQGKVHKLSDGQEWAPDPVLKAGREKEFADTVNRMGKLRGDTKERWARVRRYQKWIVAGKPGDKFDMTRIKEVLTMVV